MSLMLKNGTKGWFPQSIAADLIQADQRNLTLGEVQRPVSVSEGVSAIGTAADTMLLMFPASAPVTVPLGTGADLLHAIIEGSPMLLMPGAMGREAQSAVLKHGGSATSATRTGAATELIVDQALP